jgi:hypothetical protein
LHLFENYQIARHQDFPLSTTMIRTHFSAPVRTGSLSNFLNIVHEAIEPFHITAVDLHAIFRRSHSVDKTLATTVFPPKPQSIFKPFPAEKAGEAARKIGEMLHPFPLKQVFNELVSTVAHLFKSVEHFFHKRARLFAPIYPTGGVVEAP